METWRLGYFPWPIYLRTCCFGLYFVFYASRYLFLRCLFLSLLVFSIHDSLPIAGSSSSPVRALSSCCLGPSYSMVVVHTKWEAGNQSRNPPNACCNYDLDGVIMSPYGIGFFRRESLHPKRPRESLRIGADCRDMRMLI